MPQQQKTPFAKKQYKRVIDFSGGLNNKFSPFLIKDNELTDIQNMNFDEKGTLKTRNGYIRHYSSPFAAGPVRGLYNYRKSDGTSRLIMAADDKLFYDTPHFYKLYDTQADFDAGTKMNVDTASSHGDVKLANPSTPTFTRDSVAYKTDGTQVASGTPRFETGKFGKAIMVEEGTTNIFPHSKSFEECSGTHIGDPSNSNGVTTDVGGGWKLATHYNSATIKISEDGGLFGSKRLSFIHDGSSGWKGAISSAWSIVAGKTYTVTVWARANQASTKSFSNGYAFYNYSGQKYSFTWPDGYPTDSQNVGKWVRGICTFTATADESGRVYLYGLTDGEAGLIIDYDGLQVEQKPYATSFIDGTRSAETLTIPTAGVLNPQEYTVEMWIRPSRARSAYLNYERVIEFYGTSGFSGVWLNNPSNSDGIAFVKNNGPKVSANANWNANDWIFVAISQKSDGMHLWVGVAGSQLIHVSNTNTTPFNAEVTKILLGSNIYGNQTLNGLIDDLRISSIARTDEEISDAYNSGASLPWDEYTTYKLEFDGNLNFSNTRAGSWISDVIDISSVSDKTSGMIEQVINVPANTSLSIYTSTSADKVTWSDWALVDSTGHILSPANNYLKIKVKFTTTSFPTTPTLSLLRVLYDNTPVAQTLATGLSATARYQFATQNDILFIVNGENVNKKWDGTTFADQAGSPPIAKYIRVHKNRMFLAGNPTNPSRLYFSELGDPENWPVLYFIDIGKGDGDKITGFGVLLDNLVIFKTNSIWVLQGDSPSNFVLRKVVDGYGSVSQTSITNVKETLTAFTKDGVFFFDGVRSALASEKIEKTIKNLNKSYLSLASAVFFDNKLYIAVPEGDSMKNNLVLVFDTLRTAWTLYRGIPVSEWVVWRKYNQDILLFSSSETGQVYEFGVGYSDDGNPIEAYFVTKHFDFGVIEQKKLVRSLIAATSSQVSADTQFSISFFKDQEPETPSITINSSANGKLSVTRIIPSVVGVSMLRTLAIKGKHVSADKGGYFYSVTIEFTPKGVLI